MNNSVKTYITKIENVLTHWSVAQAGSNDEKKWRSKISLDCPFKKVDVIHSVKKLVVHEFVLIFLNVIFTKKQIYVQVLILFPFYIKSEKHSLFFIN